MTDQMDPVRRAGPDDVEAMVAVVVAVAPEGSLGMEAPADEEVVRARLRSAVETACADDTGGSGAQWVVERDGAVVGYAGVRETHTGGVLGLAMAIRPEGRGRGAGRALLQACLDHARATGAHKVDLEVWTDNARAIALYVAAGFQVEGVRRAHYRRRDGTLRSALIMATWPEPSG